MGSKKPTPPPPAREWTTEKPTSPPPPPKKAIGNTTSVNVRKAREAVQAVRDGRVSILRKARDIAVAELDYETAARLRDLEAMILS